MDGRWHLGRVVGLAACLILACSGPTLPPTATPTDGPSAGPSTTPNLAPRHAHDGIIDKAGLRHDSRDTLYRTPGGAVPAGTPVQLRLRTFHDDVTAVTARVYSVDAAAQTLLPMTVAAGDVSCYDPDLTADACDFWQVELPNATSDNVWYRFIVADGAAKAYYADDTPALDGGLGAASGFVIDQSYALTVYEPDFAAPAWTSHAVFYQIFPDRFRNGDPQNDPQTGDPRYDDPVVARPWDALPEGYCRGYADGSCDQDPHGRDYFGGDLTGVTAELDYLKDLGVTAIYLNPIFDSASNHGYDTQDWTRIDPYFGTGADWAELVRQADAHGIRIILDGVFNHVSSDSPFFDRYSHYDGVGACESVDSDFRDWFYFQPQLNSACAGPDGPGTFGYTGWSGYDSIPVLQKGLDIVRQYFLTGLFPTVGFRGSIARTWLKGGVSLQGGASGWRLDVSGDPTFPDDWWSTFRAIVKDRDADALTVAEQWQKDTTLLRQLRGDRFDTTMNYRFRDAVLGFLTPGLFDGKGFPASGAPIHPADFAARMLSQQEDYPPTAYRSMLNLIDSHDTERALWTLTPGAQTPADREQNAANLSEGVKRLGLATLIQFTMPGAPMIYYGDEVGLTGDDDPDNRRTYPWPDLGGSTDEQLKTSYQSLTSLRSADPALTDGDLRFLVEGTPEEGTIAYSRQIGGQTAIVAINRSATDQQITIPVAGLVPNGTRFTLEYPGSLAPPWGGTDQVVADDALTLTLPALSGVILVASGDFSPPAAPTNLSVSGPILDGATFTWVEAAGAASYNMYGSPVSGGGYIPVSRQPILDSGIALGSSWMRYFVVTAVDAAGNESGFSNEVAVTPPA